MERGISGLEEYRISTGVVGVEVQSQAESTKARGWIERSWIAGKGYQRKAKYMRVWGWGEGPLVQQHQLRVLYFQWIFRCASRKYMIVGTFENTIS